MELTIFWKRHRTTPLSTSHFSLDLKGSEAIRRDSLSSMFTSLPCQTSYALKSMNTVIQLLCIAMLQVPAAGRHCSSVSSKVLTVGRGGHHCCSLARKE